MPDPANLETQSKAVPLGQHLDTIKTLGGLLDDLQTVRIMNGNRIGALERDYGESLPHLDVIQRQLGALEHLAELELIRAWRHDPLAPWAKTYKGVGEKSIARLVAIIGDPAARPNVAKLWAYCGHGDPARSIKRKGMTQDELFKQGSPRAKKQVFLIAEAIVKRQCGACKAEAERADPKKNGGEKDVARDWYPVGCTCAALGYTGRDLYNRVRVDAADKTHERECVRCGPSGHPAAPGSPWSLAHQHAHGLRRVGKQFLKELWIASRQIGPEPHTVDAGANDNVPTASPSGSAAGTSTPKG